MALENEREIYRAHREAQTRYDYFLLAAAGAAIGFALTQTHDAPLTLSQIPLGAAVASWGLSFYCGCRRLAYVESNLYANMDLLKVESGRHPKAGQHQEMIAAASEGIQNAIEWNSNRARLWALGQFRLLVFGAISYVAWHVLEMYLRS